MKQFYKISRGWLALVLLCLAGCAPQQSPPQPTVQPVTLTSTPSLASWRKIVGACALKIPGIGLLVNEYPAGNPGLSQADLSLRLDPSPDQNLPYQSAIGKDEIVIIVPANNPLTGLTMDDLRALFNAKDESWAGLLTSKGLQASVSAPIQVWTYPQGDELQTLFSKTINQNAATPLPATPGNLLNRLAAPDPSAMIQAVGQNSGAIGFTLKSSLSPDDTSVRVAPLDDNAQAKLEFPVIASMKAEPQGLLRQLVLCSQAYQP